MQGLGPICRSTDAFLCASARAGHSKLISERDDTNTTITMTLLYAVICRASDAVVLTEACDKDVKGLVSPAFVELLTFLRDNPSTLLNDQRTTFVQSTQFATAADYFDRFFAACSLALGDDNDQEQSDDYYFHVYRHKDILYACLSDNSVLADQKVHFAFLDHVQTAFTSHHRPGRIRTANAYALDKSFLPQLRSAMHYHNTHARELRMEEKVRNIQVSVESVTAVMGKNLNMALERADRYETLLSKSESLTEDVKVFKKKARYAKRKMQSKYYMWSIILFAIITFLVYLAAASACGVVFQRCIRVRNDGNDESADDAGDNENKLRRRHF